MKKAKPETKPTVVGICVYIYIHTITYKWLTTVVIHQYLKAVANKLTTRHCKMSRRDHWLWSENVGPRPKSNDHHRVPSKPTIFVFFLVKKGDDTVDGGNPAPLRW